MYTSLNFRLKYTYVPTTMAGVTSTEMGEDALNAEVLGESECGKAAIEVEGVEEIESRRKDKQRTEAMSAYDCFVQDEKRLIDSKKRLDMKSVNIKWWGMSDEDKKPYLEESLKDKLSLGEHYREGRKWKNKKAIKTVLKSSKQNKEANLKLSPETAVSQETAKSTSLCSLIDELKTLDKELGQKTMMKLSKSCEIQKLKVESEFKLKQISEIDALLSYFKTKCKVLKKGL